MKTYIKSKLAEADSIIAADAPDYDLVQRIDDLQAIVRDIVGKAIELEQPAVLKICQTSRRVNIPQLRLLLVRCLAALPPEKPTPLMNADDVASRLNISVRSVWRMRSAGELPKEIELGKSIRWNPSDINEFVKGGK